MAPKSTPSRFSSGAKLAIGAAIAVLVVVIMSVANSLDDHKSAEKKPSAAPTATARATGQLAPPAPAAMPDIACRAAPAAIVDAINASFTNGEHLDNTQSVNGPNAMTYVGGDINSAEGSRESSRDAWLLSGGVVYALTSDARRRTMFTDGRDVAGLKWTDYNDALANCVGRVDGQTPG